MLDWSGRIDDLAFHLATQYRMEDRTALEILLSALVTCPRTSALWFVLETNWFSRDCQRAWFSFGETWKPQSLPLLRALRPRNANQLLATWLMEEAAPHLFVEPDYDRRLPHYGRISESRYLLGRSLRLRMITTPDGATRPTDERVEQTRTDQLRALAASVLEDRARLRPPDPPAWREPPNFLYYAELAQRLGGWHQDWGQTAAALRSLAIRHAHLYGRTEIDEEDWNLLGRVASDMVPPWIARAVQYLLAAPDHRAQASTLQHRMCLDARHHELNRLRRAGVLTSNDTQKLWELVPEHVHGIQDLLAGRAFKPLTAPARSIRG